MNAHRVSGASPAVIFLHLPKTAGTTLNRIAERHYDAKQVHALGPRAQDEITAFKGLQEEERARVRFLTGHMAFGLHPYLPHPATYITLLRHPVERVISFFYYIRHTEQHYLHDLVVYEHDMDLEAYLDSKLSVMVDNGQTRLLAGSWLEPRFGQCTHEMLTLAKRRLDEHFCVVGVTERFDETLLLLRRRLGWRSIHYERQNVAPRRPKRQQLPAHVLRKIERLNELDMALYEYANQRLTDEARALGAAFALQKWWFPWENRLDRWYWELRKHSLRVYIKRLFASRQG